MLHEDKKSVVSAMKAELERAKEDPELQAQLIQNVVMRGVGNLGKIATWEKSVAKKVEGVLGEEQAREFLSKPRKPVLDENLESIFEGLFD